MPDHRFKRTVTTELRTLVFLYGTVLKNLYTLANSTVLLTACCHVLKKGFIHNGDLCSFN